MLTVDPMAIVNNINKTLACKTLLDRRSLSKFNACKAHQVTIIKTTCTIMASKACWPNTVNIKKPPLQIPHTILPQNCIRIRMKKEGFIKNFKSFKVFKKMNFELPD